MDENDEPRADRVVKLCSTEFTACDVVPVVSSWLNKANPKSQIPSKTCLGLWDLGFGL